MYVYMMHIFVRKSMLRQGPVIKQARILCAVAEYHVRPTVLYVKKFTPSPLPPYLSTVSAAPSESRCGWFFGVPDSMTEWMWHAKALKIF